MLTFHPTSDPHCGRSSDDLLRFGTGGEEWTARWGRHDAFGSPAYWVSQAAASARYEAAVADTVGGGLLAEIVFCLLGGYGVTVESAMEAHSAVRPMFEAGETSAVRYEDCLRSPLPPRGACYRFPRQRAHRVALAVERFNERPVGADALELRDWLLGLPGIGPKTAAWIVRNNLGSDEVAIIDIWLVRALTPCGVFPAHWNVARHYDRYEEAFLQFADQGRVRASVLDLCIWSQARSAGQSQLLPPK